MVNKSIKGQVASVWLNWFNQLLICQYLLTFLLPVLSLFCKNKV